MQDPRYKHEYLDSGQIWNSITGVEEYGDKWSKILVLMKFILIYTNIVVLPIY